MITTESKPLTETGSNDLPSLLIAFRGETFELPPQASIYLPWCVCRDLVSIFAVIEIGPECSTCWRVRVRLADPCEQLRLAAEATYANEELLDGSGPFTLRKVSECCHSFPDAITLRQV